MDTWLVTGGRGLLGGNALDFLRGRVRTVSMTRQSERNTTPGEVSADLRDPAAVRQVVEHVSPRVILHAAAVSRHEDCERNPDLAEEVNVRATGTLAAAANMVGAKIIYISTDAVFDGRRGKYSEEDEPAPFSVYGQTKLEGERAAMEGSNSLVVRTNFFGWSPSGSRSILEFFLGAFAENRVVGGYTDFSVSSIYAQDLVAAIWGLTRDHAEGLFHVSSRDALSKFQYAQAVAEEFGYDPTLITPTLVPAGPGPSRGSRDISLDVSKLERTLGEAAPTQAEGLASAHRDMPGLRARIAGRSG